jgi:adenine phosphoribosyltransferase
MILSELIRNVPNFPVEGIQFKDITTLLKNAVGFKTALDLLYEKAAGKGITKVVGIESRGFILGGALAVKLNSGFVPIRKPGKLPAEKVSQEYSLEYGTDRIEIHKDAINEDDIVLMHDDLLATGGTMQAACKLVESLGGRIAQIQFLIELDFLKGREKLSDYNVESLIHYNAE